MKQAEKALQIQRTLGTRAAAGYLRNRGWCLTFTLHLLIHSK